jgi:ABC-type hemin transport system substrate-binding protein
LRPLRVIETAKSIAAGVKNFPPIPQTRAGKRHQVIVAEKSALLWMYGREIASFDTPAFSKKLGEIVARATSMPQTGSRS